MSRARFHEQHPELVYAAMTGDQAETALCVMDALFNGKTEGGKDLWDWFCDDQGGAATRMEIMVAGIILDRAWEKLQEEFGDELGDLVQETFGCWDYEWVPTMIEVWMKDPNVDFFAYTSNRLKQHIETTQTVEGKTEEQIVRDIANHFSHTINEWLTPEELIEVNRLNAANKGTPMCETHRFCDPNQAMIDAYEAATGLEWSGTIDKCTERCEKAWIMAKEACFIFIDEPF